ncbi:histone deacetylase family protein [Microvirga sp. W0021]|uniref:Histone deacetylase family protein n=1 Tax=Hohaiivirga grylli TaxID=3133970 RepID=A0ABV0BHZ5_9HYPH
MSTLYVSHSSALDYETPLGHPERADRIRVIERALERSHFSALIREQAITATPEQAALAHPAEYIQALANACQGTGTVAHDDDVAFYPGTLASALFSAGAAIQATHEVMSGAVTNSFAAMRPPGHHAEHACAKGFCYLNNAAIAARYAQKAFGAERIAILDWDVHHGNGTQDICWHDPSIMYCSTHVLALYPHTGDITETGETGNIVNAPLPEGDDGGFFRLAMEEKILPAIQNFAPDLIIISAGFDAHWSDPLGTLNLTEADFAWATAQVMELAARQCNSRIVSVLEGGYDLQSLSRSVAVHVDTLMGA